jgi:hypothetical protein
LKPERWGSLLVQENNHEEKACDKRIIIIIIINHLGRNGTHGIYLKQSNAVTTHSYTKRSIPRGLSLTITILYSTNSINKRAEQS